MQPDQSSPKRKTYFQWVRLGLALYLGAVCIPIAGLISIILFQAYSRQFRYEPVEGTVLKSVAEPCADGMFTPVITFSYMVDRRRFTTGRYRDAFGRNCLKKDDVQSILAKYPQGSTVDAWYDPEQPKLAVIDRSMGAIHYGLLVVLMAGFVATLALALLIWRRHRSKSRPTAFGGAH